MSILPVSRNQPQQGPAAPINPGNVTIVNFPNRIVPFEGPPRRLTGRCMLLTESLLLVFCTYMIISSIHTLNHNSSPTRGYFDFVSLFLLWGTLLNDLPAAHRARNN